MKPKFSNLFFSLASALLATSTAHGQSGTWTRTAAGPFNWSDTASWSGGTVADGVDNTANFSSNTTASGAVVDTNRTIGNITYNPASAITFNISGANTLTLDRTVGVPIIDVTQTGRTLTISSAIAGNDGLQKNGAGTLTLSGSNTFTGDITISGGTLNFTTLASLPTGRNFIFTGNEAAASTLQLGNALTNYIGGTITVNSGAYGNILPQGASQTYASAVSGSNTSVLAVEKGNSGNTITITDASAFTGILRVGVGSGSSPVFKLGNLTDAANYGNLQFGGSTGNPNSTFEIFNNSGSLTFNNRQIEILSTSAGAAPTLSNNQASASNTWVINTDLINSRAGATALTLTGTNTGNNTFGGVIGNGAGTISLSKTAAGKWIVSNVANTYTGTTTITGGILSIAKLADGNSNSSIGASTNVAGNLILNGGTLQYTGGAQNTDRLFSLQSSSIIDASGTGAVNLTNTGSMGFNGGTAAKTLTLTGTNTGNNTLAAVIGDNTGATSLTKTGIGTWVLSGANGYTGTTSVNGGLLKISGSGTLGGGTAPLALGGGSLDLGTSSQTVGAVTITAAAGSGDTISNGSLTGTSYAATNTSGNALVSANLLGSGVNFTKTGAGGTVTLSGTNSYTGTTTVTSGTLATTTAVQGLGTNLSGISIGGAGTLSLLNNSSASFTNGTSAYNIANSASGATINVDRVSGTGSNTITVGNLTTTSTAAAWQHNFTGANGVSLSAGTLTTPSTASASTHTINNTISGGGSLTLAAITLGGTNTGTLAFTGNGNTTVTGAITQPGSAQALTKNGTGTLTLRGANSYTGLTSVIQGTLLLDMASGGSLNSTGGLTLGSNTNVRGTFEVKGAGSGSSAQTMGNLTLANNANGRIVIDPNGGTGTTLTLGNTWAIGSGSSLLIDYSSTNTGTRQVVTAAATSGTGGTLSNGIYGKVLVKDSAGVVGFGTRAAGTNQAITRYDDTTGTTLVNNSNVAATNFTTLNTVYTAGILNWNNAITNRSVNSLTIDTTINGGTIDMGVATNALTLTSGAILFKGSNDLLLTGGRVGGTAEIVIHQTGTGTLTINSLIGTAGAVLTKDGAGTLVVGAENTFTGSIAINEGILKLGAAGNGTNTPLGVASGSTQVSNGGALDLNGITLSTAEALGLHGTGVSGGGALTNSGANANWSGAITIKSDASIVSSGNIALLSTATVTNGGNNLTLGGTGTTSSAAGVISGTGGLVKAGTGTWTLSATNTYTGLTSITAGNLQLDGSTAAGSTVAVGTNGTLSGSGTVNGNATMTGGGIINKSSGTIAGTLGVTGGNWNGAGAVTGLVTSSSGTFDIAAAANLTAASGVLVTGGNMIIDGTLTGALTANSSTSLSGTGTVTGAATVSGSLNPGNSPGVINFGNSLTLTDTTDTNLEILGTGMVRGTDYDGINIGTALAYNGDLSLALGTTFGAGSYTFNLFDQFTGFSGDFDSVALTGSYTGSLAIISPGIWQTTTNSGNETWTFTLGDGNLNLTVIPEPSSAALLGALGMLALLRRRRA